MAKPVVFVSAGGKPVVIVAAGGLPVTEVSDLGQPVTEVSALGQPVTLVADEGAGSWAPSYVNNGGTAYLSYDGVSIGSNSALLEILVAFRALDTQPAAITRIVQNSGARVNFSFTAPWRINVILNDPSATTLVNWSSANNAQGIFHTAGEYEFRLRANLGATPSFEVWVRTTVDGVTGDWTTISGSFATGPLTGTIDIDRGGLPGNELSILASTTGTNPMTCDFGYLWWQSGALQDEDAFGANGLRIDPLTVGTPDLYVTGPAASLTDDQGAGNKTLVVNGSFTDV